MRTNQPILKTITITITIKVPPINFGLRSGSGISGDKVAGLLGCALGTPAHNHHFGDLEFDDLEFDDLDFGDLDFKDVDVGDDNPKPDRGEHGAELIMLMLMIIQIQEYTNTQIYNYSL